MSTVRNAPPMGKGLFATRDWAVGETVASFVTPVKVSTFGEYESYYESKKLPSDIGLQVTGGYIYDASWSYSRVPTWWRINHSDYSMNVKPSKKGKTIVFNVLKPVAKGQQFFWNYGKRDPSWPEERREIDTAMTGGDLGKRKRK